MVHKTYTIADDDVFDIANYPEVAEELAALSKMSASVPSQPRADIVISYLGTHSIKTAWVQEYGTYVDELITFIRKNAYTESLLAAGKANKAFIAALEHYIQRALTRPVD